MVPMRRDDNIDTHLSMQQFGFRKNRGTVDAIFIVRQIMEKANKHQILLHVNVVDFKAAFDNIWRGALWKMLRSIWVDPKITSLIEAMYDMVESAVVINGQLAEWFRRNRSDAGLFVITCPVQFVPGVRRGRLEELMQAVQARYRPQLWHQICRCHTNYAHRV